MIRTAVLAGLALGVLAAPALAFETRSAPAPKMSADFTDTRTLRGMTPGTTSAPFHFGPAEAQALAPDLAASKKSTVIYDLSSGKPADQIDVTDPRDTPFLPQPARSSARSPETSR